MARRATPAPLPEEVEERIIEVDVRDEMAAAFLEYSVSVIHSRALPDARDGLKPVQRRILYAMSEMGLTPDKKHVKCSRVVGEVMGKYHPHGDTAIYDALVRMAQPFTLRLPLVDGHGNFGSLDDGPAAARYTEARMAGAALLMTESLDEDTVDFVSNYDDSFMQPSVLPAAFPNLLVNGASGIAVGMATTMVPHNLVEVIGATRHLISHPDASLDDLMRFVPGPDLPGGGRIVGLDGIREAYAAGRGPFRVRATARVENVTPRKRGIVVTELPYLIGPEKVIEKIKLLVSNKKLLGISDVKDLSDRTKGLHLVIEVKNGFHPEAVLEQLYRMTPMEETVNINAVALVEGSPRTLGLKELLELYVEFRTGVVRRRTQHRLDKARGRLHLVEGLLVAILDIDEVIALIRSSDDTAEARTRLMSVFDLSEAQASYILELQLRRLTKFSRLELEGERDELAATIERLQTLLGDVGALQSVVSEELAEVARRHGTPRRTVLLESAGESVGPSAVMGSRTAPLEVADDPCHVLLSSTGLIARSSGADPLVPDGRRRAHDALTSVVRTTARSEVGLVTSRGRVLRQGVVELPTLPPTSGVPGLAGGIPLGALVDLEPGERVLALTTLGSDDGRLALGTARGVVKRVHQDTPAKGESWDVIRLDDGDEVVGAVQLRDDAHDLVLISSDAQLLHFPAAAVRPQGRSGGGMAGIRLEPDSRVVFFGAVPLGTESVVVTVAGSSSALPGTDPGTVKVTPYGEYPGKGRATGGVRCHRFLRGEDALLLAWAGPTPAYAASSSGGVVDLPPAVGRRDGSGSPVAMPIAAVSSVPPPEPTS